MEDSCDEEGVVWNRKIGLVGGTARDSASLTKLENASRMDLRSLRSGGGGVRIHVVSRKVDAVTSEARGHPRVYVHYRPVLQYKYSTT